jgi:hypothetical protein
VSEAKVSTLRPVVLILTGSSRKTRKDVVAAHEDGLRFLLLIPGVALVMAAALIIALSLTTGSPVPVPDAVPSERVLEVWTSAPVIEEQAGDETTRRPR